jgi:hypothetical protein
LTARRAAPAGAAPIGELDVCAGEAPDWSYADYRSATPGSPLLRVRYSTSNPCHALPAGLTENVAKKERARLSTGLDIGEYNPNWPGPRHVQFVAFCFFHAAARFRYLGFRPPYILGDLGGRIDLWIDHLPGYRGGTTQETDQIVIDRGLVDEAAYTTIAHELFHRIQYNYNAVLYSGSNSTAGQAALSGTRLDEHQRCYMLLREGTARLAEDLAFDRADRYADDGVRWLAQPRLSLLRWYAPDSKHDGATYETGLFWKYVAEQYGKPVPNGRDRGADTLVAMFQATATRDAKGNAIPGSAHAMSIARIRRAWRVPSHDETEKGRLAGEPVTTMSGRGAFDEFLYLDEARKDVVCSDTAWGNFLVALALNGTGGSDSRFRFAEERFFRGAMNTTMFVPADRRLDYAALGQVALDQQGHVEPSRQFSLETLPPGEDMVTPTELEIGGDRLSATRTRAWAFDFAAESLSESRAKRVLQTLPPYACVGHAIRMPGDGATRLLRIRFAPRQGQLQDGLVQLLLLDGAGRLRDLIRHDCTASARMDHVLACRELGAVVVLVASRQHPGDFTLTFSRPADQPVVYATPWNCRRATNFAKDPAAFAWNWTSDDIDLLPGLSAKRPTIALHVRNHGTKESAAVGARLFRRPNAPGATWPDNPTVTAYARRGNGKRATHPVWTRDQCARENLKVSPNLEHCIDRPQYEELMLMFDWPDDEPLQGYILRAEIDAEGDKSPLGKVVLFTIGGRRPVTTQAWDGNIT